MPLKFGFGSSEVHAKSVEEGQAYFALRWMHKEPERTNRLCCRLTAKGARPSPKNLAPVRMN